jgi:tetratricopeptide (TPR) repeat protein
MYMPQAVVIKSQIEFRKFFEAGNKAFAEGKFSEGGKIFLSAMKEARRLSIADSRLTVVLYNLAQYYFHQKRYRKAESTLQRALEHCERLSGRNCNQVSRILNRMADINMIELNYERAEALYTRSVQIDQRLLGNEHPQLAQRLLKLGWLSCVQGDYNNAQSNLRKALDIQVQSAKEQSKLADWQSKSKSSHKAETGAEEELTKYFADNLEEVTSNASANSEADLGNRLKKELIEKLDTAHQYATINGGEVIYPASSTVSLVY